VSRRHVVITGGASGIGRALAAALVREGATAVIADLDGEQASTTAKELTATGPGRASGVALDVRDHEAVVDVFSAADRDLGGIDLAVNNAGIAVGGAVHELDLDHWDRTFDVNVRGVVHGVRAVYPLMVARGHGQILNTASLAGLVPAPLMAPYTASKHAVVGLSLALRSEAAVHGVKVSVLCPGFVDTPLLDSANPGMAKTHASEHARGMATRMQRRLYSPDDLARDVLRGLGRDKAVIVAPASARFAWAVTRFAPRLAMAAARFETRRYHRDSAPG
jgi:NAD(P)-dependent dehydrogenase (short-subunit alcohol dehydrogenase family)